ncbi:CHASE domain-containing protein [Sulfuricurvum sp.]|uniref:CHASE domain-containing protein n=1 Tax=Sulfuricurvum sp. TaxID=2025608 RepID=UPI003BB5FAD3
MSRSVAIAWFAFIIALGITFLLWSNAQKKVLNEAKNRFDVSVRDTVDKINNRMQAYEHTLQSGAALLNTVEMIDQSKWENYIRRLKIEEHYPGFQGIGYSIVITPENLSSHIAKMHRQQDSNYTIKPFGQRKEYHSIIYLAPLDEKNKRAIGYDMFTNLTRQQAMIHARDSGNTALSGKVTLVQETDIDVQAGFLMYTPLYTEKSTFLTLREKHERLKGFIYAPFRANDLMREILNKNNPNIAVSIYDGTQISDTNLLYESQPFIQDKPLYIVSVPIVLYGRTWTAVFQTLPSFNTTINMDQPRLVILAGLPISFLVLLIFLSFSQTVQQAKYIARKMTAEIRALNDELENMINTAPNPIIVHSEDGRIVKMNQTWSTICGYTYEETPTTDIWIDKVYREENHADIKAHIRYLFTITEKVDEGEFTFYSKSGAKITWQFSSAPFGIIDGQKALISSAMDVTELKHKDDLMMMQSRHAAMGEMINMIAHQWRQPLASISAISGLLSFETMMDQYEKNHFTEKLDLVSDLALELSNTINDFRNFFKKDKIKELTTWQELVQGSMTIMQPILISKSIKVEIAFDYKDAFETYSREMKQVILNFIKNSEDILTDNLIAEPTIWIRTFYEENMSCFEIEDNGGGIPGEILNQIFDPYFSTKIEKNGTGIGLYMSKIIVEKHAKGSLSVYNTPVGACFKICLPLS